MALLILLCKRSNRIQILSIDKIELIDVQTLSYVELSEDGWERFVLDQNLDTSNPTGRLLFNMLGAIAEFETEIRSERQLDGIHKAKELGVRFGRKQLLSASQVIELHLRRTEGTLIKILMKDFSLSKASVYRYLKKIASPEL